MRDARVGAEQKARASHEMPQLREIERSGIGAKAASGIDLLDFAFFALPGAPGDLQSLAREIPCRAVTVDPFPCRDQRTLFKREIAWVRRCQRTLAECPAPRCMHAIVVEQVLEAAAALRAR